MIRTSPTHRSSRSARHRGFGLIASLILLILIVVAFVIGFALARSSHISTAPPKQQTSHESDRPKKYACAMMCIPPVENPGKCPVCGMEMVEVEDSAAAGGVDHDSIQLSPTARKLAGVETQLVERRPAVVELSLFGKVALDETRVKTITARVAGRIDTLYVNYTGVRVQKGDHLISLYSPELLTAQEELLQAVRGVEESKAIGVEALRDIAIQAAQVARSKMLLWGLTQDQLDEIEKRGTPSDHITIFAPLGGVVLEKQAVEGMYVEMGERLFSIADLSTVWVKLEAYESDLAWIRYGQQVEFTTEAIPGETVKGMISFIDPVVDEKTRTVRVRVNVDNAAGRLKPEMFVRGRIEVHAGGGGQVFAPHLAGKWISPMHPEIVKDAPGPCDVCGMALVSAESLGYATTADEAASPLLLPKTAVLLTGKRGLVYVEDEKGAFRPRPVELGPLCGEEFIVTAGLTEGERVAVRGALRLDSAAQIQSKASMMQPSSAPSEPPVKEVELSPLDRAEFINVLVEYFKIHDALAHDDLKPVTIASVSLMSNAPSVTQSMGSAPKTWSEARARISAAARRISTSSTIATARVAFEDLSKACIAAVRVFGVPGDTPLRLYHCPMAFNDRGADWLQNKTGLENPYFGAEMFTCGLLKETLNPRPSAKGANP